MSQRSELSLILGAAALLLARRRPLWALGLGTAAAGVYLAARARRGFARQVVVVAGGSRGLGLALAMELRLAGAQLVLLARDEEELAEAVQRLQSLPGEGSIRAHRCDVTQAAELASRLDAIVAESGRIDFYIHNAGAIAVGPFASLGTEDFEAQWNVHLRAAVLATSALLPHFRRAGGGRIAYISSLGGKMPVPHMAAYCASKFALAGFSQSAAAELAGEGIFLTTVFPGLMRTGSPIQAEFKGDAEREFRWFALAANTPLLSMGARRAARQILAAVSRGDHEVILSLPARAGALFHALLPETFQRLSRLVVRLLPRGENRVARRGADLGGALRRNPLLWPWRATAWFEEKAFNQARRRLAEKRSGRAALFDPALGEPEAVPAADRDSSSSRQPA